MRTRRGLSTTKTTPWFEGTPLWAVLSIGIAILLTAIPTWSKDLRWLLFLACPFLWATLWITFNSTVFPQAKWVLFALLCLIVFSGAWWAYAALEPTTFRTQQKQEFTAILKTVFVPPASTLLACPEADEDACVYAAEFIPLFQRAGWKIEGPIVERVKLARATREILIVRHGPPLIHPQNPDEGMWTELTNFEQTVTTAFEFIGQQTGSLNDPLLPANKIRIYFGSVPNFKRK